MILYEILVPASSKGAKFSYEHHKEWDEKVKEIADGLTVLKTGRGEWVSPNGETFYDRVIPVRIACSKEQIMKILKFTKEHYKQLAIFCYKVSEEVIIYE